MSDEQLTAISIPIQQIRPDPAQPRRWLPRDLAEALSSGTLPSEILVQLRERGKRQKWIRERAAELDALADSIATDGLMQPIRVFQDGDDAYRIEAGERRWWAHNILLGRGDSRFETIATFVIQPQGEDKGILRRRVAENVHRSGFTAIELARAMATRAEEIATEGPTLSRREIERRVGKENGMSDRRVRQFLGILKLTAEVQEIAQQARLTESSLRALVTIKDPARQIVAAHALVNPKQKQTLPRLKAKVEKKKNIKRPKNRALKKPRRVSQPVPIQRLIALAREMRNESIQTVGQVLGEKTAASEMELKAIVHLRDILNRGLVNVVGVSPKQSRVIQRDNRVQRKNTRG